MCNCCGRCTGRNDWDSCKPQHSFDSADRVPVHMQPGDSRPAACAELIVNKHDKKDSGITHDRLSDKVRKYSTIPVRIISSSGQKQHLGRGEGAQVLEEEGSAPPKGDRTGAKTTPAPRSANASPQYPADKTDVVSHAKRIAKGVKNLMSRTSGSRLSEQGSSDFSSAAKSSGDSGADGKQGT